MGNTKTTQSSNNTQTATATPQEQQLENNELNISNANQGNQMSINNNSASLINSILTGNYSGAGLGINAQQNQSMVNQSLRDIAPQFQTSGILNSGEAGQLATQTAALTSNANAQFNTEAQQNLFSQALGGASSWSAMNSGNNQVLGSQLAGLRTVNSSGSTVTSSNPFLNSFYSSLGQGLGSIPGDTVKAGISAIPGGGAFSSAMGAMK